jgi:hypothetical protein
MRGVDFDMERKVTTLTQPTNRDKKQAEETWETVPNTPQRQNKSQIELD